MLQTANTILAGSTLSNAMLKRDHLLTSKRTMSLVAGAFTCQL